MFTGNDQKDVLIMDKRERFDDIFRERLYDLKYNPTEAAWEGIAARLPRRRFVHKRVYRVVAVAAVLLLVVSGSILYLWHEGEDNFSPVTVLQNEKMSPVPLITSEKKIVLVAEAAGIGELKPVSCKESVSREFVQACSRINRNLVALQHEGESAMILADCDVTPSIKKKARKWRIGVGSGNLGLAGVSLNNVDNIAPSQDLGNNTDPEDNDRQPLSRATSTPRYEPEKSTRVKHLMPVSIGLSVSYPLNERWSFQTGLTYTYLRSKWKHESSSRVVQKQSLHFIGIPVSVNYRLTNWLRPYCYFNAGVLAEVNVAGRLKNSYGHEDIRVPGILWTTYTRVGIAYPLIRFVSIYAEGGMCYYFNYRGTIETVRSENAFNFTGQLGLRLNF